MFSVEERCAMIREILPSVNTVDCRLSVDSFKGLTAEFAKSKKLRSDCARDSCGFRLRIRTADGIDEPEIRADNRDGFSDG